MNRRSLPPIILFMLAALSAWAQYYRPQSPLEIKKDKLKKDAVVQTIQNRRVLFTPIEIDELRLQISKNNNAVDNEISMIKSRMSNLFMDKQELLQLKDIRKIREVIEEKKTNRREIEAQVQNDLSGINYKGLFIVVLKSIDPWSSKQDLSDQSEKALAPRAIEDLNGIFISSMTSVEQSRLMNDKIQTVISGEMSIEKQYISRTIDNRGKFLYLAKINVAPLKKSIKAAPGAAAASENTLIVNAMTAKDYGTRLQNFGVSQDEIRKIDVEVQSAQEPIQLANATASRRQMDILRNGNANLNKIDDEIRSLENSLANRSGILRGIIEDKTDVTFDPENSDQSIDAALKFQDSRLEELRSQMIHAREQELIPRYSVSVTAEGTPADDIARTALDIAGQIEQSYSRIEQFVEETTIQNFMLTEEKKSSQEVVYRKIDTVWLYPVAGDQDNFYLTVVAKFKTTSEGSTGPVKTTREPEEKKLDMILVKGGLFRMGDDDIGTDHNPFHPVQVNDFYISKFEVTCPQFCEFANAVRDQLRVIDGENTVGPSNESWFQIDNPPAYLRESVKIMLKDGQFITKKGYENHPIDFVSWYGAKAYSEWIGGRLPTEAEWEYAARGGKESKNYLYSGGDDIHSVAWYCENTDDNGNVVGSRQPNELGIFDMSGNVAEWCDDWFSETYYPESPLDNPTGSLDGTSKIARGGHRWTIDWDCRTATRGYTEPVTWGAYGIRVVKNIDQ